MIPKKKKRWTNRSTSSVCAMESLLRMISAAVTVPTLVFLVVFTMVVRTMYSQGGSQNTRRGKVEFGMTFADVEHSLGQPTSVVTREDGTVEWTYSFGTRGKARIQFNSPGIVIYKTYEP